MKRKKPGVNVAAQALLGLISLVIVYLSYFPVFVTTFEWLSTFIPEAGMLVMFFGLVAMGIAAGITALYGLAVVVVLQVLGLFLAGSKREK
jgi:hypothetical protein